VQLFKDLAERDWSEKDPTATPPEGFTDQPRKLLIQLYGQPKDVKGKDRPEVESLADPDKAEFIREALLYDHSEKIDRAVRDLLTAADPDRAVGWACIERLVGRGYDVEIEDFCRRRLKRVTDDRDRENVREVLDQLGWTPLHVAVARGDFDSLQRLLRGQVKVDTAARNRRTPLHLAAAAGNLEAVRLLADAGASLDPKDCAGHTPAQLAARGDHVEAVALLAARAARSPTCWWLRLPDGGTAWASCWRPMRRPLPRRRRDWGGPPCTWRPRLVTRRLPRRCWPTGPPSMRPMTRGGRRCTSPRRRGGSRSCGS
jgi:hypothetical protein